MGFLSRLFGRDDAAMTDGRRLYALLLKQARRPAFFGSSRVPDSYEGRIEVLTLHMNGVMACLRDLGEQGQRLSQAVFDAMVENFDIALREEGLTDSGVKRRIKPMVQLFYTRLSEYDALINDTSHSASGAPRAESPLFDYTIFANTDDQFKSNYLQYALALKNDLKGLGLGQIAQAQIEFPKFD